MLYFSQLKGKKIVTEEKKIIGTLRDVLFLSTDTPLVTKLLLRDTDGQMIAVPIESVKQLNHVITLSDKFPIEERKENELSVMKNLMDRQIIDVKGSKVVRVNDVAIQDKLGKSWYIAGVDIGFRGILRWMQLETAALPVYRALGMQSHPHFLSWTDFEPLELEKGKVQLKKDIDSLERMRPEDLADYLEQTNIRNVNKVVTSLDEEYAADVIEDLNANFQSALFRRFSPEKAAKLIELIDPDDAVDILLTLPKEKRKEILEALPERKQKKLISLLKLSNTAIGQLITTDYIYTYPNETVQQTIEIAREKAKEIEFAMYIYVINEENQLTGVFKLDELFRQEPNAVVANFMEQDIIVVHLTTPLDIAIKRMLKYKIYALPVLDANKQMLGIITFNDVAEDILEEL
jgi:magnesium transporter